jgi:hypothetical protein
MIVQNQHGYQFWLLGAEWTGSEWLMTLCDLELDQTEETNHVGIPLASFAKYFAPVAPGAERRETQWL